MVLVTITWRLFMSCGLMRRDSDSAFAIDVDHITVFNGFNDIFFKTTYDRNASENCTLDQGWIGQSP